ncbi:unnamed protein product [Discosporangium mesarthrocarpum]
MHACMVSFFPLPCTLPHLWKAEEDGRRSTAATWGITFHPRKPKHMFSCLDTGVLLRWELGHAAVARSYYQQAGGLQPGETANTHRLCKILGGQALTGVCYDEGVDVVSSVTKHGHLVVVHGCPGLRV